MVAPHQTGDTDACSPPGLTYLDPALPANIGKRHPLTTAWRALDHELDPFITSGLAAA